MTTLTCLNPVLLHGSSATTIRQNLERLRVTISTVPVHQRDIVLLPLGCLSGGAGTPAREALAQELEDLHTLAQEAGCYLAGGECFAGEMFGFIFGPAPDEALWQLSVSAGTGSVEVAVLSTAQGSLACLPGADLLHAEYARLALFAGAEIILHPTLESADERSQARHFSRGARAYENLLYVAVCALGDVREESGMPHSQFIGSSLQELWHPSGQLLANGRGGSLQGQLDLPSLRTRRSEPWVNFPAQLRTSLYANEYRAACESPSVSVDATSASNTNAETLETYDVLLMQAHQKFVTTPETRDVTISENLKGALGLARMFAMRPATRLVVFPEFFLQGSGGSYPHEYWERCGIRVPGPETDQLAEFARTCNVYVCGAILEYDPDWPQRYFNTSIIVAPSGEIVLRYRKLQCADLNGLLNVTTPGNIYSEYIERYGQDALVPVIDTPIGRLGTVICFDSNWPELWRVLALKGAEVICNPTSEIHSNRRPYWYQAKRAHAAEHLLYVASANAGSEQFFPGGPVTNMNRGHSALIDFHGELVACADGPGIIPLLGRVELGALRRARDALADDPRLRFRAEILASHYANFEGFPLDCFASQPMKSASEGPVLVAEQIQKLQRLGIFRRA